MLEAKIVGMGLRERLFLVKFRSGKSEQTHMANGLSNLSID